MSLITKNEIQIQTVRALKDNYCYLIARKGSKKAAVIDPSEASPIEKALEKPGPKPAQKHGPTHSQELSPTLALILNTHHHHDHVGGNVELARKFSCPVYCSKTDFERVPAATRALAGDEVFNFDGIEIKVLNIPGHTQGQIAYYIEEAKALFVGDTVFEMGCGRLFEGTPEQMYASLEKIKSLPKETRLYFGHEYAETNARFAKTVQPENGAAIEQRLGAVRNEIRATGVNQAPMIEDETRVNPFFRAKNLDEFARLRSARDSFN